MGLKSMTGYGSGEASGQGVRITAELSSVNRKQLDIHVNLPRSLHSLESGVSEEIQKALTRGRVNGEITLRASERARSESIRVDETLARSYLKALRKTAGSLGLEGDFKAEVLLTLPEVVKFEQAEVDPAKLWPQVRKALRKAVRELVAMRSREGANLEADLAARLQSMAAQVDRVTAMAPAVQVRYREQLEERIEAAGVDRELDEDRLLREVVLFADRSDIAEETTRLKSHLAQAGKLLKASRPSGRSLDFLAQEMFREINTIGSKANDTGIARIVVNLKTELERIREQVQNIE